ncbi:hypothetical protein E4U61_000058 [Claviceps capensis]|nr:hypothetical protein E4U61_000058 [Claviceps capensis]
MEPSGADKGFFQNAPVLKNQALEDESFKRCFNLVLQRNRLRDDIMLSRTPAGGLSTFLAPIMRKHDLNASTATGEPDPDGQTLNGIRIQRLKNKFGTQSLPTAELVLENTHGWLIGQEGRGVQEISSILTLTRIHSTVAAVGGVGRCLAIARAYSLVREVGAGNKTRMKLLDSPLHMRTLAKISAEYHRLMLVTFYASCILGVSEHGPTSSYASHTLEILTPPEKLIEPLLRSMAQLAKAYVCKASVALLFSCMEALGGVMRQVSRFRGKADRPTGWEPERIWTSWRARLEVASAGELMGEAREIVWAPGDLLVGLLLFVDAGSDGGVVVREMLVRFLEEKGEMERRGRGSSADELGMDLRIVFGVEGGARVSGKL